ncbi:hypothetical protein DL89DRAFT_259387 [Linderina pennispora]|uniref:Uncharacterized protein n=1 Tax=Linderina pennispora TaxID=61395 RepID=A0A1Y1W2Z5_9FUNG|nr:uncharacterized protein DL89DRAFT_259387 [Linderina pennispora]ORX67514.1 hypothetical protein DL89DRAFT_259387 [Linderina pennispora]
MRFTTSFAATAFFAAAMAASSTDGLQSTQCVSSDASDDLYSHKVDVKYAKLFSVDYHKTYKKPSEKADAYIEVPVRSAAAWATTAAIFIEALGVQNNIKNLGTAPSIVSPCLQKLLQERHPAVQRRAMPRRPSSRSSRTWTPSRTNTVYSVEYLEGSALGRSEWVKFFAPFFNAEERANKLFDSVASNYDCFKSKASKEYNDIRPVIAWTSYAAPSKFNNNTAYWQVSYADYKYNLVRDAGARMLNTTDHQTTKFTKSDAFLHALEEADILIDESGLSYNYTDLLKNYGIDDPSKVNYTWVKNSRIYRPDLIQSAEGGLGWFEAPFAFADRPAAGHCRRRPPQVHQGRLQVELVPQSRPRTRRSLWSLPDSCKDELAQRPDPCQPVLDG